jgi:hypothetical protein
MTHPIIKTENYLLVGSNDDLRRGWFYCVRMNDIFQDEGEDVHCCMGDIRIAAHLPLNTAPTLEGVPLLPPLEDDAELAYQKELLTDNQDKNWVGYGKGINGVSKERWKSIYSKAKEKYKYTEEDLKIAINMARNFPYIKKGEVKFDTPIEKIIQSLQQPKYPVAFECEMGVVSNAPTSRYNYIPRSNDFKLTNVPKTITNSQGLTQLVGKYIY